MSRIGRVTGAAVLMAAPMLAGAGLRVVAGAVGTLRGLVLAAAAVPLVTAARSAMALGRAGGARKT
ncbi:MAG TPA: hypothetical protein VIA61_19325 [Methylomirabilota bacterium]